MRELRRVPPGRAGRLWLRQRLGTARHAVGLLDRKLRVLRAEQQRFESLAERTGAFWRERSAAADEWLVRAALLGGERDLRLSTPAEPAEVCIEWETVMGARYPVRTTCRSPALSAAAPGPGTAALVEATAAYRAALAAAVEHSAALAACRLVDAQVAETRRLTHAIEDRWIPRLESALRELTQRLEENERAEAVSRRWAGESCSAQATVRVVTKVLPIGPSSSASLVPARRIVLTGADGPARPAEHMTPKE